MIFSDGDCWKERLRWGPGADVQLVGRHAVFIAQLVDSAPIFSRFTLTHRRLLQNLVDHALQTALK